MRSVRVVLLLLLAGLAAPGVASAAAPRIVGGSPAAAGEFPWQAFVRADVSDGYYQCGGTLVSPTKVVTAAHCTRDEDGNAFSAGQFTVVVGGGDVSGVDADPDVSQVAVDPAYDPDQTSDDAAVLTLATPVSETPLRLVDGGETAVDAAGVQATATGYGTTSEGGDTSDALLKVQLQIQSDATCSGEQDSGYLASVMLCAGPPQGGKDTCQGDSGGPLTAPGADGRPALIGITSFGYGCAEAGHFGKYTRLRASPVGTWLDGRLGTHAGDTSHTGPSPTPPSTTTTTPMATTTAATPPPAPPAALVVPVAVGLPFGTLDPTGPNVRADVGARGVRLDSRGRVGLRIVNANAFALTGTATLSRGSRRLGRGALSVGAHASRTVRLALSTSDRRRLRRAHRLSATLRLALAGPVGAPQTITQTVLLRRH